VHHLIQEILLIQHTLSNVGGGKLILNKLCISRACTNPCWNMIASNEAVLRQVSCKERGNRIETESLSYCATQQWELYNVIGATCLLQLSVQFILQIWMMGKQI